MRHSLRRQLLHFATDLAALVERSEPERGIDLLTRSYKTPAADAARASLRSNPAITQLMNERYWGHWPSQAEFLALPSESLGHSYASCLASAGGDILPDPVLQDGSEGDDIWLHQRIRHSHDVWHVVCGCPPTVAGEAAISAVNVIQLRWPGSAMVIGAHLMQHCMTGSVQGHVDVGPAISYGLELGRICAPLLAQRWEEGWDEPLDAWRQRLGIADIVADSPFHDDFCN